MKGYTREANARNAVMEFMGRMSESWCQGVVRHRLSHHAPTSIFPSPCNTPYLLQQPGHAPRRCMPRVGEHAVQERHLGVALVGLERWSEWRQESQLLTDKWQIKPISPESEHGMANSQQTHEEIAGYDRGQLRAEVPRLEILVEICLA